MNVFIIVKLLKTIVNSFFFFLMNNLNLGFLGRCESSSCSGNSGLSDLVAALKMLTNILPAFGGDPNLITLLGWGSGASLVSKLILFFKLKMKFNKI